MIPFGISIRDAEKEAATLTVQAYFVFSAPDFAFSSGITALFLF